MNFWPIHHCEGDRSVYLLVEVFVPLLVTGEMPIGDFPQSLLDKDHLHVDCPRIVVLGTLELGDPVYAISG